MMAYSDPTNPYGLVPIDVYCEQTGKEIVTVVYHEGELKVKLSTWKEHAIAEIRQQPYF